MLISLSQDGIVRWRQEMPESSGHEARYTWDPLWVKEFESPWGIFEKFKYANNIYSKEFLRAFGTDELLSIKNLSLFYSNANVEKMDRLCDEKITQIIKKPVKQAMKEILNSIQQRIPFDNIIRSNLTYCKLCIRAGYHSIFHQMNFIHTCPFHPHATLYNSCPSCNQTFKFILNDQFSSFKCQCGTELFNKSRYNLVWKHHRPLINAG